MTQSETVLNDPTWLPDSIDVKNERLGFAKLTRGSISKEAFLDHRMSGSVTDRCVIPLADVSSAKDTNAAEHLPAFIFHSAFCCSTLLARALDCPGAVLSLKEPDVLMSLANALRVHEELKSASVTAQRYENLIYGLLSRRFQTKEKILVKPTNTANNLLPGAIETGANIVLLYSDLRSFLISVLKKGEACKAFVRQQYNIFSLDPDGLSAITQRQAMGFTDLQVAAVVWRHQMELFSRALKSSPEQVASLDSKVLMADPARGLVKVARHLDLSLSEDHLRSVAEGPIFSRNAKFSEQRYDASQRDRESREIEQRYGDVLNVIVAWGEQLNLGTDINWPLPHSL